jgi:hypothetical protein
VGRKNKRGGSWVPNHRTASSFIALGEKMVKKPDEAVKGIIAGETVIPADGMGLKEALKPTDQILRQIERNIPRLKK